MAIGILKHLRSNAIAYLALFVALGVGTAWAASLPKNSVGSKQIKNEQVKRKDIKPNAIDGSRVKDGSLSGADVRDGSLGGADIADNGLRGADIDEATLQLPAGSIGPGELGVQPHLEARAVASQVVSGGESVKFEDVVESESFTYDPATGRFTAQVDGMYFVAIEGRGTAFDWGFLTEDSSEAQFRTTSLDQKTLTALVHLDAGEEFHIANLESIANTYTAGSEQNPSVGLVVFRVSS